MGVGQQGQNSDGVVRIFLASSAELEEHRREFRQFIADQNDLHTWKQRGIRFEVVRWEHFIDAMSDTRLQDEYNKAVASCDVFVMLYRTKVGKYTAEEFETAFERFKNSGRPKLYTYCHRTEVDLGAIDLQDLISLKTFQGKLNELGHFETPYKNHDHLCRQVGQQLAMLDGKGYFAPRASGGTPVAVGQTTAERQRELDYLGNLIHRLLGAVDALWVPVEASQTRARTLERTRRTPIIRGHQSLRRSANEDASARVEPDEHFADVLDAYRALPLRRSVKRLAVLGEPGAGKSFSLQRIAHEYATAARVDPAAPVPLYIQLGDWTDTEPLASFMDHHLAKVCPGLAAGDVQRLRNAGRAVLLLDGMNEIPPREREDKVEEIRIEAEDTRHTSVIVSCRERDFGADCRLPFDELRLEPLEPWQIHDAIVQTMLHDADGDDDAGRERADAMFWRLAGGESVKQLCSEWLAAGATMRQFWSTKVEEAPTEELRDQSWKDWPRQRVLDDQRGLLRLASNPYLLTLLMGLHIADGELPSNRAELFDTCLATLYTREAEARQQRNDNRVPDIGDWKVVLVQLAEALQRADGADGDAGARTALGRSDWPVGLGDDLVAFSIDASVLQRLGGDTLRFTHQLLQEALAADVLLQAAATQARPASDFWPTDRWWPRSGWEVVAEIAAEALAGDYAGQVRLITWLARHHPSLAADIWRHVDEPTLPAALLTDTKAQWLPRLTDTQAEPAPEARAAIGRWLGALDLDDRPGTGLGPDGLPDIDWLPIDDDSPWHYQEVQHPSLPPYAIARYPVTHRQWQAFVDDGGYADDRWWHGLDERPEPTQAQWGEPTAPRETVSFFEAVAFCRWLTARLDNGQVVTLPTEQQWERAARGTDGRTYPWGDEWSSDLANAEYRVERTTMVGLYPEGQAPCGTLDMAGNVWEWCLNEYDEPANAAVAGPARRVVRGGSWFDAPGLCRAAYRVNNAPDYRDYDLGFRVVSCPIQGTAP